MNQNESFPRPEYPRPQMVRKGWLNLNGRWEFELDPGLSGEERHFQLAKPFSRTIIVPFCPESLLSGIGEKNFIPCVWYRRSFVLPEEWKGRRVLLHFGAVDYEANVWLNGRLAGTHRGGYSSFFFEITHLLKKGKNYIVVRAVDDTRSSLQPSGKQSTKFESYGCYYSRVTGIWQTVWLEAVPSTYLRWFRLYPDPAQGKLIVHAGVDGDAERFVLHSRVFALGKKVGEESASACDPITSTIKLSEVYLWEPKDPFLYELEFLLEKDGNQVDLVKSYFGLRKVHLQGEKVLINNKPVFQRLVLDQGYYPDGIYTAPTDEALRKDIQLSMKMGFNGARLHQKVFEPRFMYWADRLGYLVWGEYPNWGLDHSHPAVLERVLGEWIEVLKRDFSHPSIIGWCPFNETPQNQNPELIRIIYQTTRLIDPTRPVIDTSGYHHVETDIYDCHNYEQDPKKFIALFKTFKKDKEPWRNSPEHQTPYQGQPYFVSEYGGTWWNPSQKDDKAWGYGNKKRPRTKEEFLERYGKLTEALLFHPKISGFCYTQLYDVEQEVNGLYTYDRRPKLDPALIKKINCQKAAIER